MSDLILHEDSPIFWELVAKYGNRFDESPWSPEFLEVTPEPTAEEIKARQWPVTFDAALAYAKRLVLAQHDTMALPMLPYDQYAQKIDLTDPDVTHIIQGVLVDD